MARFAALALSAALSTAWLCGPAAAQDAAELVVRLNRLEGQVRQMSGLIEQLGFENRQQKEQLRKFQEDVEYRFQERSGGRSTTPATTQPASPAQTPTQTRQNRRSDAFDPDGVSDAPGAPRPLGTASATPPLAEPAQTVAPRLVNAVIRPVTRPQPTP